MILEVRLDGYVLGDTVLAYMHRGSLLLPLGELAALLDFPILVDAHAGRADGWFVRESRGFHLDLARGQVVISGIPQSFDVSLVARDFTELYVDSSLLSRCTGSYDCPGPSNATRSGRPRRSGRLPRSRHDSGFGASCCAARRR